jgi:flagellar hook-associated protein 1 FlgK
MSLFGIGVSGLNAAQLALSTTEHNITNVNTAGFHRQQTVQTASTPMYTGAGFIGQGVQVTTIRRVYSQFLESQLQQAQTQSSGLDTYLSQIQQIDNMLADPNAGLSPALQDFFTAINGVVANPSSVASRQSVLSGAQALAARFQAMSTRFQEIRDGVNGQIASTVSVINSYAQQIASLNKQITVAQAVTSQPANDLLDQRDQLVTELNQQVRATVVTQSDGTFNVFIGNGQPLVVGQDASTLAVMPSPEDPQRTEVGLSTAGGTVMLQESSLQGGNLGGLLAFRSESLDSAENALGRVALGLAQTFNDQHQVGQDLNGALGGAFFNVPSPNVIGSSNNTGNATIAATVSNVGKLSTSDYRLTFAGGQYTLTRLSDNTSFPPSATLPLTADGLSFSIGSGIPAAGDSWLIQPTRNGARDISVAIADPTKIAAASPILTNATLGNTGSGAIGAGAVYPYNDKVTITFNSPPTSFNVVDNSAGATLATNVPYAAGTAYAFNGWKVTLGGAPSANDTFTVDHTATSAGSNSGSGTISSATPVGAQFGTDPSLQHNVTISFTTATQFTVTDTTSGTTLATLTYDPANGASLSFNGWTTQLTGAPAAGDAFTIGPNSGGVSDNRNAAVLASLQTRNTLAGTNNTDPTTSYQGAYSQLTSDVGNKAREVEVTGKAQAALVTQSQQAQQAFSGVNLDEEAANLVRYQQAYQAAGKMLQIASTLFDTILSLGQ